MSFLDNMWQNHRTLTIVLGLVLLPITLLLIGLKLYMAFQVNQAHKEVQEAKDKDKKLEAEEDALKKAADASLAEADKAAQRIENRHEEGAVDMDWHTKRKD